MSDTKSKHTPGPWAIKPHGVVVGGQFHTYTNGSAQSQLAMATILHNSDSPNANEERDANARLIAAAPELAEAADRQCANIAFLLERCKLDDLSEQWREKFERELREDRAVIAKATGSES